MSLLLLCRDSTAADLLRKLAKYPDPLLCDILLDREPLLHALFEARGDAVLGGKSGNGGIGSRCS